MTSGRTIALDLDDGPPIPPYWTPPPPTGSGLWLHDRPGGLEWAAITPADVGLDRPYSISLFGASVAGSSTRQPIINWYSNPDGAGDVLKWQTGLDVANGANEDLVLAARGTGLGVADFLYVRANPHSLSFGVGMTPPPDKTALSVTGADGSDTMALYIRVGPGTTGDPLRIADSAPNSLFRIDSNGRMHGYFLYPLGDPGTFTMAPATPGNSGLPLVSYRGNEASSVGIDLTPVGNDMKWELKTTANGGVVASMQTTIPLICSPQGDYDGLAILQPLGGGGSSMLSLRTTGFGLLAGFDKAGRHFTLVHTAPADADLQAGEMRVWFDQTSGAAKFMVKAKDAGGTVRTGSLNLA